MLKVEKIETEIARCLHDILLNLDSVKTYDLIKSLLDHSGVNLNSKLALTLKRFKNRNYQSDTKKLRIGFTQIGKDNINDLKIIKSFLLNYESCNGNYILIRK